MKLLNTLVLLTALLGLVACKSRSEKENGKLQVVTTATMVTDLLKEIGGDKVDVHGLIQVGLDPHDYEEKSADVKARNNADAIFYVGLHFEANLEKPFLSMAKQGKNVFALADKIKKEDLRQLVEGGGQYDMHIWGNVQHWKVAAEAAVEGLVKADAENAEYYKANGEAYKAKLDTLDAWIKKRVAEIPEDQRKLVTSHDAFQYFSLAYGFEVNAIKGVSTVADTKPEDLKKVSNFIKKYKIKTIFGENATSDEGVGLVAKQAGVAVSGEPLAADSTFELGDVVEVNGEKYDRGTYIGMMKHNVNTVVEGLK